MPRIFDNIDQHLLKALKETLHLTNHADFSVGYFNLRGWKQLDSYVECWSGGSGNCCRLLIGMQRLPQEEIQEIYSLMKHGGVMDNQTALRLTDPRRSERLPWVKKMIENAREDEILAWDYMEAKGKVNTYIWLKDYDFLVLMKKYPDGRRRLLTSFYIDYPNYRRKLEKKYARRIK
jgi:hypothetical protein